VIFERAAVERRIVVSADADFGTLLAVRSSRQPSVIQFRGEGIVLLPARKWGLCGAPAGFRCAMGDRDVLR
jgi:uncharacterized protein DUF5615